MNNYWKTTLAIELKRLCRFDDAFDVVASHGVGGAVGVVLTRAFASLAVNDTGVGAGWSPFCRQTVLAVAGASS